MTRKAESTHARLRAASSLAVAMLLSSSPAYAGDVQVQNVAKGRASFERNGANTIIRAADRTVINYSRFNVPAGAGVQFIQPSATSRVLNRVNSATPSKIDGSITANGRVYLMNRAGVIFGTDSTVKAAGFYAGAANITDEDFTAGIDRFTLGSGDVLNEGRIESDVVGLLGKHVANRGTIVTPGNSGLVAMTAGDGDVMVGEQGGNILVKIAGTGSAPIADSANAPKPGVENTGSIAGKQVSLAAGDIYSLAIRQSGQIKAKDVTIQGGDRNGIVQVGGKIDVSNPNGPGGTVKVLGDKIALSNAKINASGKTAGGTILVGGDYQGGGETPSASATFASPETVLNADATHNGPGGKVVVWSDNSTRYLGSISAKGGANGGKGGLVETSSAFLDVSSARVDVSSPSGKGGTWLLDPSDIFVESDAVVDLILNDPTLLALFQSVGFDFIALPSDGIFNPTGTQSVVRASQINDALNDGISVTLDASKGNSNALNNPGDIFVDAPILKDEAAPGETTPTLTLIGPKGVTLSATSFNDSGTPNDISDDFVDNAFPGGSIQATAGKLNVVLQSNDLAPAAAAGVIPDAVGQITLFGPIRTNGGSVSLEVIAPTTPLRPLGVARIQIGIEEDPVGTFPIGPDLGVPRPTQLVEGGIIDTRAQSGVGGNVTISAPRRISLIASVFTGGGNVDISSTGLLDAESAVVAARAIDTSSTAGSPGGQINLSASGDIQVRQISTTVETGTGGANVEMLADSDRDGRGSFELLPTISTVRLGQGADAPIAPLPQPVVSFIDAGLGTLKIEASDSTVIAGEVRAGGVTITADVVPGSDGIFSQLAGAIDTGTGPIDISASAFLLAGDGIRGGAQFYRSSSGTLQPTMVIVPGANGYVLESTTDAGIRIDADVVVTNQPSEDINSNGLLDVGEDVNSNGLLDASEDVNGNGVRDNVDESALFVPTDLNGNGRIDVTDSDLNGNGQLDPNEDRNFNKILDVGEDLNSNGKLDTNEDANGNLLLDSGEDINLNGKLDTNEFDNNENGQLDTAEDINANGKFDAFEFDDNGNGLLDLDEDRNGNNILDTSEDLNGNGLLDLGEDFNANGGLDTNFSTGLRRLTITGGGGLSDITINGTLGGAAEMVLDAGPGQITVADAIGQFQSSDAPVTSFTATGSVVTVGSVFATGAVVIDASDHIQLGGQDIRITTGDVLSFNKLPRVRDEGGLKATGNPVQLLVPSFSTITDERLLKFDVRESTIPPIIDGAEALRFPIARRGGVVIPSGRFTEPVSPSAGDAVAIETPVASPSTGTSRTAAEVIAGSSPQQTVSTVQSAGVAGSIAAELGKVGVFARELDEKEATEFLVLGRSFYDDASLRFNYRTVLPEEMVIAEGVGSLVNFPIVPGLAVTDVPPQANPEDVRVAANRIPYNAARIAVNRYQELITDPATGELAEEARKNSIRDATTNTWLTYQEQAGDKASGAGYRAYIESNAAQNPEAAATVESLDRLQRTLRAIELLGLTPKELNNAKGVLLRDIRPIEETGMTSDIFEDAVRASGSPATTTAATPVTPATTAPVTP
jgi:filamentous hemagglutinin family protein